MSEDVAGAGEREVIERARAAVIALRCAYFRRLQGIASLAELGVAASAGYRSVESLIADRDNLDHPEAKRLVAEAAELCTRRSLRGDPLPALLPCTGAALAEGAIDPGHVRVIRETMTKLSGLLAPPPPQEWAGVEATLAEQARVLPPTMLRRLAKGFLDFYDPDGAAPPDGQSDLDELRFLRRRDGSLVFKGTLHDPLDAEAVVEVFGALSAPAGAGDERSLERRQADAFNDLVQDARGPRGLATDAHRENSDHHPGDGPAAHAPSDASDASDEAAAGADPDATGATDGTDADGEPTDAGEPNDAAEATAADEAPGDETADGEAPLALIPEPRRPEPAGAKSGWVERPGRALLTVTIDHRWLCAALTTQGGYATLDSGHHVDAATVRRWACDAEIIPIVLGSTSEPLDVGRAQRTAPEAIRRALNLRDGGCAFPGCTRTPRRCQAHHVHEWFQHGATALDNMCLLCRYHHQLVHHSHWQIQMIDGRPWFTPPWIIDPDREPRPGGRPRAPT